jgi:hypothetical protein
MVQNNPAKNKVIRVQKYEFLAVKTEKTAKNRPRVHFQKKRTLVFMYNNILLSYIIIIRIQKAWMHVLVAKLCTKA